MKDEKQNVWRASNASSNEAVFGSPKFSLEYLPCDFTIDATFMDLVLSSGEDYGGSQGRVYYITNPLTKQWVALPPCPGLAGYSKPWAALICQPQRDDYYYQDYKFRVVLVQNRPPHYSAFRKVVVYCSEIGEWKKIDLNVNSSKKHNPEIGRSYSFRAVVCNGIIYLNHYLGLAAFNPLDVDQTTTDIKAKLLPSGPVAAGGFLRECSGKLFLIYNDCKVGNESTSYDKYERSIKFPLMIWKLDPNQAPHIWKSSFQGTCSGNVNQTKSTDGCQTRAVRHIGMHPNNDWLIFLYLYQEEQFFLCNTRSRSMEPLKTLPGYGPSVMHLQRLELQWWPTSVPRPYSSDVSL